MGYGASDEWTELVFPTPDFRAVSPHGEASVYVRRYSGNMFHACVGVIAAVAVDPKHRREGHGAGLVRDCAQWIKDQGVAFVILNCERDLVPFYLACGDFRECNGEGFESMVPGPGVTLVMGTDDRLWPFLTRITYREAW